MVIGILCEVKSGENRNGETGYEVEDECFGGKGHSGQLRISGTTTKDTEGGSNVVMACVVCPSNTHHRNKYI